MNIHTIQKNTARLGALALALALLVPAIADAEEPAKKAGPLQPGTPAPEFRLRALDGAMVRLDELAYPGKEKSYAKKQPILVDFFRTDCSPCRKAMPELVGLYEKYHSEGVEVLLIALLEEQDGRAKLEKYLADTKVPFKVVVDEAEHFAKKYLGDPVTLPATFLIDENGTVKKAKYGSGGSYEEHFGAELRAVIDAKKASKK